MTLWCRRLSLAASHVKFLQQAKALSASATADVMQGGPDTSYVTVAVQGCSHGELDNVFATVNYLKSVKKQPIDLLISCGDFQAVRNESDLKCMAVPDKYRTMNSFWKYYAGIETAPVPTLFIGGNHEASNYLWDLALGGLVAPRIFYLGLSGVVKFKGLRIAGLSGIYKDRDYHKGHFERAPYDSNSLRSAYHVREYDVRKLRALTGPIDVFLSHDWPRGIAECGDKERLLRQKPFFRQEVETNTLGSPPAEELLKTLKPSYWFSAHLHVKFAALVHHQPLHPIGCSGAEQSTSPAMSTKFLALDKCLPGRDFLQVVKIPVPAAGSSSSPSPELEFELDEEWLAITRAYAPFFPLSRAGPRYPPGGVDVEPHRRFVADAAEESGGLAVHNSSFQRTVAPYSPHHKAAAVAGHDQNPQTSKLLEFLGLPADLLCRTSTAGVGLDDSVAASIGAVPAINIKDPNEIVLDEDEEEQEAEEQEEQEEQEEAEVEGETEEVVVREGGVQVTEVEIKGEDWRGGQGSSEEGSMEIVKIVSEKKEDELPVGGEWSRQVAEDEVE